MSKSILDYITKLAVTISVLSLLVLPTIGCNQKKSGEITFEQLFSNPGQYNGQDITLEGFYFQGFEVQVIAESLEYSGYAEEHLVPKGQMIWVEGGMPIEVYDVLYQQSMMVPEERYGKVRITGKFEYGGKYGHLGGHISQIVPSNAELLEWSP
jgi:hypothetical protein